MWSLSLFLAENSITSPFVIIFWKEIFEGIILSKIVLPFPRNPYVKTDVPGLLILFFVKDFKEKVVEFLTEQIL